MGSDTTTWRAPAWRTTPIAIRPIGPAPEMSTSSPWTSNASAVWTAFPNGSKIAATSSSMPGQWCQMFVIGSATYSAKDPSRPTPRPTVFAHRCRWPAMQCRHRPQVTWPSPLTRSPGWKSLTFEPTSTISPDELMPDDERRLDRLGRPVVPRIDMQVRPADPGLVDPDQDVVDADVRARHLLEPQPGARVGLDEGEHQASSRSRARARRAQLDAGAVLAAGMRPATRPGMLPARCRAKPRPTAPVMRRMAPATRRASARRGRASASGRRTAPPG